MTTTIATDRQNSADMSLPIVDRKLVVILLGLLTLVGAGAGIARLLLGMGRTTNLVDSYTWGIWIGFDFTLIAFAGAGFTMAFLVHVLRQHQFGDAARPAILAGLLGYVGVLLLLVLDLGRPDRFYNFLLFWNVHSPLFEISWCVLLYTTVLVIETSPFALEPLKRNKLLMLAFKVLLVVSIIGVTLSSLHQSTLGTLYLNMPHRLHPLWFTPILSVLFFVSSIMSGISVAMLVYMAAARLTGRPIKDEIVTGLGKIVGWVSVLYVLLKVGDLAVAGELPLLFNSGMLSLLMWLELAVFAALPAFLLLVPRLRARRAAQIIAPLLVLSGVLLNRFSATMFAQKLPPGTSYVPSLLEWLSTIGVLAGVALAWYLGVRFLVIFDSRAEAKYHH
jgi:Ni/Fe-hydrogenase subunit HybB-like protein